MIIRYRSVALLILILALSGCSGHDTPSPGADAASPPAKDAAGRDLDAVAETHAATEPHSAGIVPGSYEDWCAEHAVPETKCTRCDASLIPAFKATGDWCAEHGLPTSQCRSCDPSLVIARAPKPGTP